MTCKPGATFLIDPAGGSAVKSGRYDFFVVQRNRNPQHNSPAGNESSVRHGCAALVVRKDTTHNPIFEGVLNSGSGNSVGFRLLMRDGREPLDKLI